jgi:hypothetical protein
MTGLSRLYQSRSSNDATSIEHPVSHFPLYRRLLARLGTTWHDLRDLVSVGVSWRRGISWVARARDTSSSVVAVLVLVVGFGGSPGSKDQAEVVGAGPVVAVGIAYGGDQSCGGELADSGDGAAEDLRGGRGAGFTWRTWATA